MKLQPSKRLPQKDPRHPKPIEPTRRPASPPMKRTKQHPRKHLSASRSSPHAYAAPAVRPSRPIAEIPASRPTNPRPKTHSLSRKPDRKPTILQWKRPQASPKQPKPSLSRLQNPHPSPHLPPSLHPLKHPRQRQAHLSTAHPLTPSPQRRRVSSPACSDATNKANGNS